MEKVKLIYTFGKIKDTWNFQWMYIQLTSITAPLLLYFFNHNSKSLHLDSLHFPALTHISIERRVTQQGDKHERGKEDT